MKRVLPFLLLFLSLHLSAQVSMNATFNFNSPSSLSPSVTPASGNGNQTGLDNYVFTSGSVSLSCIYHTGLQTLYDEATKTTSYSFIVMRDGRFIVKVGAGECINYIEFDGHLSNLRLNDGQPGTWDSSGLRVNFNPNEVQEVVFVNNKTDNPSLTSITVNYTTRSDVLLPNSGRIQDGTDSGVGISAGVNMKTAPSVSEFRALDITFTSQLGLVSKQGITLEGVTLDGDKDVYPEFSVSPETYRSNTFTIEVAEPLTEDADYTLTVPTGTFIDANGFVNKEFKYVFKVREPRATLKFLQCSPRQNVRLTSISDPITLTYDKNERIVIDDNYADETGYVDLKKDGESRARARCYLEASDNIVYITFANRTFREAGVWTITIPEKAIHNEFYGDELSDRWNPETVLTFYVNVDPPTTPEPEPQPQEDSQTMKEAKALLANETYTGLGYPTDAEDGTRAALRGLVESETVPTDEELQEAIDNFYNDPNVVLPNVGETYRIIGISAEGVQAYLSYDDGKVGLTSSPSNAAAFEVYASNDDGLVFRVADGRFLHILTTQTHYGTTPSNVTEAEEPGLFNTLSLKKLAVEGVDPSLTFGKFSLSGLVGFDSDGKTYTSTAAINYPEMTVVETPTTELYFSNDVSSAFVLLATTEVVEDATVGVTPQNLANNTETMLLTIGNFTGQIAQIDQSKITFINANSERVSPSTPLILTQASDNTNQYLVHVDGLANGTYTMTLASGTFRTAKGTALPTLQVNFKIGSSPTEDALEKFQFTYDHILYADAHSQSIPVTDVSLNTLILYHDMSIYSGLVADPSKEVIIARWDDVTQVVAKGHFEPYGEILPGYDVYVPAIQLVVNEPITEGSIRKGHYGYVIPAGTIGDANFGRWLAGEPGIQPQDCKVNPRTAIGYFNVDNEAAEIYAGIEEVRGSEKPQVIFDLQGRRVGSATKPGLYIIDGKKMVVK